MRIGDAIGSLQLGRKKNPRQNLLCTPWSEKKDGPDAVPLSEYPRPQMVRADWTCLNGWWDYSIRKAGTGMGTPDGKILVPFSPETRRSGVQRTLRPGEVLWYRRRIPGLSLPAGMRLLLHFGAVDERCAVYWNGHKVGTHRNGYLSFSFDVTQFVRQGANELKVFVRDDTDEGHECRGKQTLSPGGMYYRAQSGIWQTVWLEPVPDVYVKDLKITPLPEEEAVELELTFFGEPEEGQEVRITVGRPVAEYAESMAVAGVPAAESAAAAGEPAAESAASAGEPAAESAAAADPEAEPVAAIVTCPLQPCVKARIPIPDPSLWSPEHPFLYPLYIEAGAGVNMDRIDSYFAMRSFGTGTDEEGRTRLLLNGEPYFFNGILDQGYWPETLMTPPADEALVFDIEQMKELGFNMLRKHVKIEPARWYYHCDRIGMVVWQDMVNGGGPVPKLLETYLPTIFPAIGTHLRDSHYKLFAREDEGARKRFERDIILMIRQLYNSPSIGMWVPFNEGWGQFDALRITGFIKEEDPVRPVDHASGWFDQGGGDVRSVHNYFRPLAVEEDRRFNASAAGERRGNNGSAAGERCGNNGSAAGERRRGRAFVISEYGGTNCQIAEHSMSEEVYGYSNVTREEFPKVFRETMEKIRALYKDGLCGAVYTQVSDIEEETNGLLTYDRKVRKL